MSEDLIGKIIQSQYRIISLLGEGGFGKTYLAEDLNIPSIPKPRRVIKKLKLSNKILNNVKLLKYIVNKFEQEAQVLYRLGEKYDFIPKLYAYFNEGGNLYLIQELIEGKDLVEEIKIGRRWSEIDVIVLLEEILSKLGLIHQENIIHRDLKPSNIMRKTNGELIFIDFGAVKEVKEEGLPQTTHVIATPGYAAREQIYKKPRFSSDIYAVGIIAIEALTGLSIFDLPKDENDEIHSWQNLVSISDSLAEIITKMVRDDYRQRYKNVTRILEDLEIVRNNLTVSSNEFFREELDFNISDLKDSEAIELSDDKEGDFQKTFSFEVVYVNPEGEIFEKVHKEAEYFIEKLDREISLEMVKIWTLDKKNKKLA